MVVFCLSGPSSPHLSLSGITHPPSFINVSNTLEAEIDIRPPSVQALHGDAATKVLGVRPTKGQAVTQPGNGAAPGASVSNGIEALVGSAAGELVGVGEGAEGVGPDVVVDLGGDAAAAVADADGDSGGVVVEGRDGAALEEAAVLLGWFDVEKFAGLILEWWFGRNGDDDGFTGFALDSCAECIL